MAERVREYELVMAISPSIDDTEIDGGVSKVSDYVSTSGGEVVSSESWGLKRLSYPVINFQEGHYLKLSLSLESGAISGLERNINSNEEVLLHLVSRI